MDIGKGIKFVRIASGIRQGEMAKRLDISQNYLSLLENNKAEPSIALLRKISDTFGVPASFLFWEEAMPIEGETPEVTDKYNRIRSLVHELQELRIARRFQETTE
ncbi:MAG: helix-turn-helix transcriptional regulator [Sedimentisphaerales bacterium]